MVRRAQARHHLHGLAVVGVHHRREARQVRHGDLGQRVAVHGPAAAGELARDPVLAGAFLPAQAREADQALQPGDLRAPVAIDGSCYLAVQIARFATSLSGVPASIRRRRVARPAAGANASADVRPHTCGVAQPRTVSALNGKSSRNNCVFLTHPRRPAAWQRWLNRVVDAGRRCRRNSRTALGGRDGRGCGMRDRIREAVVGVFEGRGARDVRFRDDGTRLRGGTVVGWRSGRGGVRGHEPRAAAFKWRSDLLRACRNGDRQFGGSIRPRIADARAILARADGARQMLATDAAFGTRENRPERWARRAAAHRTAASAS